MIEEGQFRQQAFDPDHPSRWPAAARGWVVELGDAIGVMPIASCAIRTRRRHARPDLARRRNQLAQTVVIAAPCSRSRAARRCRWHRPGPSPCRVCRFRRGSLVVHAAMYADAGLGHRRRFNESVGEEYRRRSSAVRSACVADQAADTRIQAARRGGIAVLDRLRCVIAGLVEQLRMK